MALSSPGTEITIIDESQYLPAAPNSIPLVVIATAQNKINAAGTGVAAATTAANAGKLYQVTSQRDLITYFGNPFFYKTTNGTSIQGYELNEYGLLAAYSTLGSTNLVYAIRADIDLAALVGKTVRPSSPADNGSFWLDTASSTWGIFEFDKDAGSFTAKSPLIITNSTADLAKVDTNGVPKQEIGNAGDYAVVLTNAGDNVEDYSTYYVKIQDKSVTPRTSNWVAVGSPEWQNMIPVVQSDVTLPETDVITSTTAGDLIISNNTTTATIKATINNGTSATVAGTVLTVTNVDSSTVDLKVGTLIMGTSVDGLYITALGTGTGGVGTYTVSSSVLVGGVAVVTLDGVTISSDGTASGAAGTTLNVATAPTTGTLAVGTLLQGTSTDITAGAFVSGVTYKIKSLGTTDFTTIGATKTADVVGFTGNDASGGSTSTSGSKQLVELTQMVVTELTGATPGELVAGQTLSGAVDAGTTILTQQWNQATTKTYSTGGAPTTYTVTMTGSVADVVAGMLVLPFAADGSTQTGIQLGTTVTSVDTNTNTVTLSKPFTTQATALDTYRFYSAVTASNTANKGLGIYKVSSQTNKAKGTITGQPSVGTEFDATGAGSGTGKVTTTIAASTYITALGTGTGGVGTYTVSQSQYVPTSGIVTGYFGTVSCQDSTVIPLTAVNANNRGSIKNQINAGKVPFVEAKVADSRIQLTIGKQTDSTGQSSSIVLGGTSVTLAALGLQAGLYTAPAVAYGKNSAQPKWRTTDSNTHPTGSVWIKTNSGTAGGISITLGQYSTSTGSYANKSVTVAGNDRLATLELDSTGGKAIPLDTVYLQTGARGQWPAQLFRRAQVGEAIWTGTVSNPTGFKVGAVITVGVSTPASSALTYYQVTMPQLASGQTELTATDFITAWTSANIQYTNCYTDSVTGAIVLTHTEGGEIRLNDELTVNVAGNLASDSPLVTAGFSLDTSGVKQGWWKTVNLTKDGAFGTSYTGNGVNLNVNITTVGYTPTITIDSATTGGTLYQVGDVVSVDGTDFFVKVTSVSATGAAQSIEWYSGEATPEFELALSPWEILVFNSDDTAPVESPANGTLWFHSVVNQIDIMTNVGSTWVGYKNALYDNTGIAYATGTSSTYSSGPICAASEPTVRPDGAALTYGDLWVDTGDLENFPVIYRWKSSDSLDQWVLVDNTDQTTENGIVFADARWGTSGTVDPVNDAIPTIISLLSSDYIDLDAPDASTYPQGTLLFNTRRSGYNVKKFTTNYFTAAKFTGTIPTYSYTWVSASGNKSDGSPYMGRKAQRAMVVAAMKSIVDTSSELREEATSFNLIAAPGYPELQPNMVSLNNDRNETAYIIGDTPLRLANDANALTAWATNAKGATGTGEDGLVSRNTYLGIYYPSGITTDLTGADVVVPASHMILRTIIHNDTVAYPWFAPAGMRRGTIDNATNIGYIDADSGEFQTTKNRVALRDIQYTNFINPIAYFQNVGLLNYGNKNSYDSQSALDRTNVARLICYIRDRLQVAVRPFIFEPNDDMTRSQVKDVVSTLLADIKAKRGVYDYLVVCDSSNNTAARIDRSELWIDIAIEPVKAVEFIYIPVRIMNTGEIAGL